MLCSIFTKFYNHHHYPIPENFHVPIKQTLPILPSPYPWQPQFYFMSLRICLWWTSHINGIIQYMTFCVWLLLLSIMFSRFIHVATCISPSFLFLWLNNNLFHIHWNGYTLKKWKMARMWKKLEPSYITSGNIKWCSHYGKVKQFLNKLKIALPCDPAILLLCVLSCFSHVWVFAILQTAACQASLSMGFSRQEYWNRLPCPPPGDLPDPGIESTSLMSPALAGRFFSTSTTWELFFFFFYHLGINT